MSTGALDDGLARLAAEDGVLVRVEATEGSAPREAGTWMLVWAQGLTATIGGGQLEFQAIDEARALLQSPAAGPLLAWPKVVLTMGTSGPLPLGQRPKETPLALAAANST